MYIKVVIGTFFTFIYVYIHLYTSIKIYTYLHLYIFSYILNSCIENFNLCKYTYLLLFKDIYIYKFSLYKTFF